MKESIANCTQCYISFWSCYRGMKWMHRDSGLEAQRFPQRIDHRGVLDEHRGFFWVHRGWSYSGTEVWGTEVVPQSLWADAQRLVWCSVHRGSVGCQRGSVMNSSVFWSEASDFLYWGLHSLIWGFDCHFEVCIAASGWLLLEKKSDLHIFCIHSVLICHEIKHMELSSLK